MRTLQNYYQKVHTLHTAVIVILAVHAFIKTHDTLFSEKGNPNTLYSIYGVVITKKSLIIDRILSHA